MHSVWTGQQPFSAPRNKTPTLVLPNTMVLAGKRPSFPPGTLDPIVGLAKRCWDDNPALRPEIGEIVEGLQHPSLLASVPDVSHFDYRECGERILLFQRLTATSNELGAKMAECERTQIALIEKTRECEQLRRELVQRNRRSVGRSSLVRINRSASFGKLGLD
jgi:hypothetical protein